MWLSSRYLAPVIWGFILFVAQPLSCNCPLADPGGAPPSNGRGPMRYMSRTLNFYIFYGQSMLQVQKHIRLYYNHPPRWQSYGQILDPLLFITSSKSFILFLCTFALYAWWCIINNLYETLRLVSTLSLDIMYAFKVLECYFLELNIKQLNST